jgi:hypothetical protein
LGVAAALLGVEEGERAEESLCPLQSRSHPGGILRPPVIASGIQERVEVLVGTDLEPASSSELADGELPGEQSCPVLVRLDPEGQISGGPLGVVADPSVIAFQREAEVPQDGVELHIPRIASG